MLKKICEKTEDIICWLETHCWWLPMAIGILALLISTIVFSITIGFRIAM